MFRKRNKRERERETNGIIKGKFRKKVRSWKPKGSREEPAENAWSEHRVLKEAMPVHHRRHAEGQASSRNQKQSSR
jgi:hypothetical protein